MAIEIPQRRPQGLPSGGHRRSLKRVFAAKHRSALQAGELLTAFEVPASGAGAAYEELSLQPNGRPIVNVAVAGADGDLRIGIGGLLQTPRRAQAVESDRRRVGRGQVRSESAAFGGVPFSESSATLGIARGSRRCSFCGDPSRAQTDREGASS